MLTICTWLWGSKYGPEYIKKLRSSLERHMDAPFDFRIMRPQFEDEYLTAHPGCFARLRMFDPWWQSRNQFKVGDRIVCVDLDVVITGKMAPLFDREEPFVILQGTNAINPCPYNGSIWMLRVGYRSDVWHDFSPEAASLIPFYAFPDDQAWFEYKMPNAAGWKAGPESGVYAFQKPGWPEGESLPEDARMVAFPGWRDPSKFSHLPWVREHWSA